MKRRARTSTSATLAGYDGVLRELTLLIESARRAAARSVNAVMTATYFLVGRAIVEEEQRGARRAAYGDELLGRLAIDLSRRFGRGFSPENLRLMRLFYLQYRGDISQTLSGKSARRTISETVSGKSELAQLAARFPLPWSHYVLLLSARSDEARRFYETEALRGGWSVRQLRRQLGTLFYERTAMSRNKGAMLEKGGERMPSEEATPEEELKDRSSSSSSASRTSTPSPSSKRRSSSASVSPYIVVGEHADVRLTCARTALQRGGWHGACC